MKALRTRIARLSEAEADGADKLEAALEEVVQLKHDLEQVSEVAIRHKKKSRRERRQN